MNFLNSASKAVPLPFGDEQEVEDRIQAAAIPAGYKEVMDAGAEASKQKLKAREVERGKRSNYLTRWGLLLDEKDGQGGGRAGGAGRGGQPGKRVMAPTADM